MLTLAVLLDKGPSLSEGHVALPLGALRPGKEFTDDK